MKKMQQLHKPATDDRDDAELGLLSMASSVLASFFGVQSSKARERDFQQGNAKKFIGVGVAMTIVWYGAIYLVVTAVLKFSS